ncbi:MAG: DUF2461 domain-containing protein [Bacteroidales bacterium]|nr:DUF2461 domain-containing protein [Bacteroidales bacterium]MBO7180970.1 DUF2461 domain-containing protein [Bacteroidales bacterium]
MKRVIDFLSKVNQNNNKVWFDEHKQDYKDVKAYFDKFVLDLVEAISDFDETIYGLSVSDCTYRIYRDVRFSKDKTPYKTHIGAYVCPKGKKSGLGGYYFHVEPFGGRYLSSHLLATGVVCMPNDIIRSIREDVFALNGEFEDAVAECKGFELDLESMMKKMPKDFPKDCGIEALKLRDFLMVKNIDEDYLLKPNLVERLAKDFSSTRKFKEFINRAISASGE